MSSYGYGSELQCCKGVVDPITFLTMLAVIAAISIILRQAVLANIKGRRKKRGIEHKTKLERLIMTGESIRGDLGREHVATCKPPLLNILNLFIIILCTHLYHFFPVSIQYLQCIHCLLHQTLEIFSY